MPLLEAAEQMRKLKIENQQMAKSLATAEKNLAAKAAEADSATAELKARKFDDKKLRSDIARCATATLQLVGHLGNSGKPEAKPEAKPGPDADELM